MSGVYLCVVNWMFNFRAFDKRWSVPTKDIVCRYLYRHIHGYCGYCDNSGKENIVDEDKLTLVERCAYDEYKLALQMTSYW